MGIANKHNSKVINWSIDTKDAKYKKANELPLTTEFPFLGCFTSQDNGYGEGGVIITKIDDVVTLINTPQSFVQDIKDIRADQEQVDYIKAGKAGFMVESYKSKYNRTGYRITLIDHD